MLLLVDADGDFREVIAYVLAREGYHVIEVRDLRSAARILSEHHLDLVLLDPALTDANALEFCEHVREEYSLPTIMVAERDGLYDAVRCLDAGAEDFLYKPCDFSELTARVRAALRRRGRKGSECFVSGPLRIDLLRREVRVGDRPVWLGPTEFRLLEALVTRAGRVVPSAELLRRVWRSDSTDTELLRVTVYRLRRKLAQDPRNVGLIRSVPGVGFMFDPQAAALAESQTS